ncbi:mechanosensitive ion channel family protein [Parasphaerochaeta coccoides]|uniref:MscS Mechanosensitive ion channel n=1 Tax=Parasphaerochaeta coccoides (strain ATCC BAA-1237 / DSM 17374 / SPN1) TaxID=760011 RepID=F4GLX6_PARC1|nr:mechanosensitive ion channel family protein [Parasphaerochaeta coccoides]AEC03017.1 MscS Mechanosensitive ion channel [Parasphaerochaeta coccoides DSM 17374]
MIPLAAISMDVSIGQEPVVTRFFAPLKDTLISWFGEGIVSTLGVVLGIIVTIIIGKFLLMLVTGFFRRTFSRSRKITPLMASFIIKVINTIGWAIAGIMCLQQLGINMVPVITGLGITGVIAGLAFQESLGNLLAGVMIVINEPIRIGDWIDTGSFSGTVLSMDMMCITLAAADNKHITIANKLVWSAPIVNYSFTDRRRVDMTVAVPYGTDLIMMKSVVASILGGYEEVLKEPAPVVEVLALDASTVKIIARPWVLPANYWRIFFRFQVDIYQKMEELGVDAPRSVLNVLLLDAAGNPVETPKNRV